jgi:hypothetical protein
MPRKQLGALLGFLRAALGTRAPGDPTDADLLHRFAGRRDEEAFAALLQRHGPLVLSVCRRVLGNADDADDAFQATFLVLVRKAGSIRKGGSLASWLHGVALRVALEVATGKEKRTVKLWDVATGKEKRTLKLPGDDLAWSLAFSPDGKTLATGSGGGSGAFTPGTVILWEVATGKQRAALPGHQRQIYWVGFSPDGKTLASASGPPLDWDEQGKLPPGQLKLWNVATAKECLTIPLRMASPMQFFDFVFTADGKTLIAAMASFGDTQKEGGLAVRQWEVASGKARATHWAPFNLDALKPRLRGDGLNAFKGDWLKGGGHNEGVFFVALSAEGKSVAWGGAEERDRNITGTAQVWEVQSLAAAPPRLPK